MFSHLASAVLNPLRLLGFAAAVFTALHLPAKGESSPPRGIRLAGIQHQVIRMIADPQRPRIYAITRDDRVVSIDTETFAITGEVDAGAWLMDLDISLDGSRL